jgi:hypothetical protein
MQLFLACAQYADTTAQVDNDQHRDEGNRATEKHDLRGRVKSPEPFNSGVHQGKQQDAHQHCAETDERIVDTSVVERIGLNGDQAVPLARDLSARDLSARIMSAAFSAAMMVGPLVLPEVTVGKIDVSTTRRRSTP